LGRFFALVEAWGTVYAVRRGRFLSRL